MKYEWKKEEKKYYLPKTEPELVNIPFSKYITIKGHGDPNKAEFSKRVEALYLVAYGIKMLPKSGYIPNGYYEYTVYPLEGIWSICEEAKSKNSFAKDEFVYKIMIKQPEFVTLEIFQKVISMKNKKKTTPLFNELTFEIIEDGLVVQMLHCGSYDDEIKSFNKMNDFLKNNNLNRIGCEHKEIYLSNPKKTEVKEMKTVLRFFVSK